ncbi:MAG TPA: hypothetical protein VKF32_11315, partial [Thermoanaerobaculia bacterium]|nr:hypothetical protein [Thermoanaerobaculia bacterium]
LPFPANAPDGNLSSATAYALTPSVTNLDGVDATHPAGDLDRVEFFLQSVNDVSVPSSIPVFTATSTPFAYSFVAAYAGNGTDPRPFPVWAQAVDTSTNRSELVKLPMQVLPNAAPTVTGASAAALSPVAGTFYSGSRVRATALGVSDPDGAQVTVSAEFRKENTANANDPADLVASAPGVLVTKLPSGWADLAPPALDVTIPLSLAEGTRLVVRVTVIDSKGASVNATSAAFAVADDANAPSVTSLVAKRSGTTTPATLFTIGQRFFLEARARDAETAVKAVSVSFDGVFAGPVAASLVAGTTDLYRTAEQTVPTSVATRTSVVATAAVDDWGGNTGKAALTIQVGPTDDPTSPVATWTSPWDGALWPAAYTSVVSPGSGAALLLRVKATDKDRDGSGNIVTGSVVAVEMRGPIDAAGNLAASFTPASLVSGTAADGGGVYQLLWHVPNGVPDGTLLPFEVRVVDTGANETRMPIHVKAVRARRVFEGVDTSVLADDALTVAGALASDPVFLLDGTRLSFYPQTDGSLRRLGALFVWAGGVLDGGGALTVHPTILTAPEVTSYQSLVPFYPLELAVDDALGIGAGARADMTGKGLLGTSQGQSIVLPGERGSASAAGGSHAGYGAGSSGSVFDSLRDPHLPGGGGGAVPVTGGALAGGTAGGVIRLLAGGADVRLEGDATADGVQFDSRSTGGAGGAIRIVASHLAGFGHVSASGGPGGGAGGRISFSTVDPLDPSGVPSVQTDGAVSGA